MSAVERGAGVAARKGALPWIAYGLVECFLCYGLWALTSPRFSYVAPALAFTAALWSVYAIAGALTGIVGAKMGWQPQAASRVLLALAFFACIVTNFALPTSLYGSSTPHGAMLYAVAVLGQSLVIAGLAVVADHYGVALGAFGFAFMLILPWWALIAYAQHSRLAKGAIAAGSLLGVALVAFALGAAARKWPVTRRIAQIAAATVIVGVSLWAIFAPQRISERPRRIRDAEAGVPNVVLITLDTVRDSNTSVGGYARDTTPNLARFAKDAWLYPNTYASSNNTLTTHASIFTGLEPSRHGAIFDAAHIMGAPLAPNLPSLPEILGRRGYATAGIVGNSAYLGWAFGFPRGFDSYDQRVASPLLTPMSAYCIGEVLRQFAAPMFPAEATERLSRRAEEVTDSAIARTETLRRGGHPFFLFVNYIDAHMPYLPPASYMNRFGATTPWVSIGAYEQLARNHDITPAQRQSLINRYDASILYLDHELGRFLDYLHTSGLADRTLIIVTSDHGEAFGARGYLNHHQSLYDDQIAVPLVIRFPGEKQGRTVDALASSVDLFPTILGAAHAPLPEDGTGVDLRHPVSGRTILSEHFDTAGGNRRAIIDATRKLIVWDDGRRELYDLRDDPGEHDNRSTLVASTDLDAALIAKLRQLQPAGRGGAKPRINEKVFRSLGYLR